MVASDEVPGFKKMVLFQRIFVKVRGCRATADGRNPATHLMGFSEFQRQYHPPSPTAPPKKKALENFNYEH